MALPTSLDEAHLELTHLRATVTDAEQAYQSSLEQNTQLRARLLELE